MNPVKTCLGTVLLSAALIVWLGTPAGAGVAETKHNLSLTGPGPIKSTVEEEICVFCHTPHKARRDIPYLWNRANSVVNYTTYESSTLYASVGQPAGASKLCLSCHDGTIALGAVLSRPTEIPFAGGLRFLPEGPARLGTDLSDDHPISFVYDDALTAAQGQLASPSTLTGEVKLDRSGMMQCTSCHDAHEDEIGNFLVLPNRYSNLCVTCHRQRDWDIASHALSAASWNGAGSNPWPHTEYTNVAENGCESCHSPHSAGGHAGLLNYLNEEDNCLVCHSGNVASTDIEAELLKPYGHRVQDYTSVHDPAEDFSGPVTNHVECSDCHNPHRANPAPASAPLVRGAQAGVRGITLAGSQVREASYAYEICYTCHADNNVVSVTEIARQSPQLNTRLEFDVTNPSFHPVAFPGKNMNVPSLLPEYSIASIIYCTDCHNSDEAPGAGGVGPSGPHGSNYKFLLERNYTTSDPNQESSFEYALCYKCHDRNSILGDESFSKHDKHVRDEATPCSTCHDPHGISASQGDEVSNSNLINFDINVVEPNSRGERRFEDRGTFAGTCNLRCHGKDHDAESYP